MQTENLVSAISFAMSQQPIQKRIAQLESLPQRFQIVEMRVLTRDTKNQIHQVVFNFKEVGDTFNTFSEDIIAVIQGNSPSNFKLLKYTAWHTAP